MVQIDTTKMSSKGQIVIPNNMRGDFKEGDTLLIIKDNGTILLKKANDLDDKFKEDLEFARRTEEAWKEIDEGKGVKMGVNDFLKEMEKW